MLVLDIFSFPWLKLASFVAFDTYSHHFHVLPQIFMTGPGIDKLMKMKKFVFYFGRKLLTVCIAFSLFALVVNPNEVTCAALFPKSQQEQEVPLFVGGGSDIQALPLAKDYKLSFNSVARNPNIHNMVTRFDR